MRAYATALVSFVLALSSVDGVAASYTCKDTAGNWTEQACPGYQARQQQADEQAQKYGKHWEPRIGMTAGEVSQVTDDKRCYEIATTSAGLRYCGCRDVNTTRTARGTHEQWVFGCGGLRSYMYFDNGVLASLQE